VTDRVDALLAPGDGEEALVAFEDIEWDGVGDLDLATVVLHALVVEGAFPVDVFRRWAIQDSNLGPLPYQRHRRVGRLAVRFHEIHEFARFVGVSGCRAVVAR